MHSRVHVAGGCPGGFPPYCVFAKTEQKLKTSELFLQLVSATCSDVKRVTLDFKKGVIGVVVASLNT